MEKKIEHRNKQFLKRILFVLFIFFGSLGQSQVIDSIPKHETFTIQSSYLKEMRTINVWVPENYSKTANTWSVLYMLDGGIKEDFPHIANTLADLIRKNKIKPMILVGIENTQRRRDLTGFTEVKKDKKIAPVVGGAEKFRSFIQNELFPAINKRYRTNSERTIIGESLAGLFAVETFLTAPEMFDNYIVFDPSLWWNKRFLLKSALTYLAKFPQSEKKIWFAGSNAKDVFKNVEKLAKILQAENLPQLVWNYLSAPNEQHNTIFRATKEKAMLWMFQDSVQN
jgi:predicted alpha/beta superfamily hydrolase